MNSNCTKEIRKPLTQTDGKDAQYMCCNEKIHALLGIDDFEQILHSISASTEQSSPGMEHNGKPEASGGCIFYMPVMITSQSLLQDLDRMLAIFNNGMISAKNWEELEKGFFDLLFVKFKLYCIQMKRLGRTVEVQATKQRLMHVLNDRMTAKQSWM